MSKSRIALVTGGGSGIGAAICRKLASDGYFVYLNCRRVNNQVSELADEIRSAGGRCRIIEFDVTNRSEILQALQNGFTHSRLDALINNAGVLKDNLIYQIEAEDWNKIIQTNFFGAFSVFRLLEDKLLNADRARVVSIASISGMRPRKGQLPYAVSKAMLIEWTRKMSAHTGSESARFFAVSPGPVTTRLIMNTPWYKDRKSAQRIPLGRYAEATEIASLVSYLLTDTCCIKNGSNIVIDGGFMQTAKE